MAKVLLTCSALSLPCGVDRTYVGMRVPPLLSKSRDILMTFYYTKRKTTSYSCISANLTANTRKKGTEEKVKTLPRTGVRCDENIEAGRDNIIKGEKEPSKTMQTSALYSRLSLSVGLQFGGVVP